MHHRAIVALLVCLLGAAVVSATTIAELVANGATLAGQTVTVAGTVIGPKLNGVGESTFNISDANGQRVSVFGKGTTPSLGAAVAVTGVVGYKAPDEEFTWPPVLHAATW